MVVALVLVLVAATTWWWSSADDRRVDAACGDWLAQRPDLRNLVDVTEEAAGRAAGDGAGTVTEEFGGLVEPRSWTTRWDESAPRIIGSLDNDDGRDETTAEEGLYFYLVMVDEQLDFLQVTIADNDLQALPWEIDEARSRFQGVDDICLSAARGD